MQYQSNNLARKITLLNFGAAKRLEYCMFSEATHFEYLTQGESPQVNLSEANRLTMFVKANFLEPSLIITFMGKLWLGESPFICLVR